MESSFEGWRPTYDQPLPPPQEQTGPAEMAEQFLFASLLPNVVLLQNIADLLDKGKPEEAFRDGMTFMLFNKVDTAISSHPNPDAITGMSPSLRTALDETRKALTVAGRIDPTLWQKSQEILDFTYNPNETEEERRAMEKIISDNLKILCNEVWVAHVKQKFNVGRSGQTRSMGSAPQA